MTSLDDLPLDTGHGAPAQLAPTAPTSPGPRVALLVLLVAGVVAAGAWFYVSRQRAPGSAPARADNGGASAAQTVADAPPIAVELPPLAQMDPFVRELFASLGTQPELLKWLATDDLVGAMTTAIDRLSQGQSPSRDLAALRPTQAFGIARRDGVARVDPKGYARYAPLVDTVAAVDPAQLAAAFTTLRPRLAEAYASQGHPGGGFDEAVRRAIAVVAATPDVPDGAALVPGVGGYAYADPAFEQLPPAQKHLVRMGPDHARRVREAARRFGEALTAAGTAR